jgi:hypothetical protein
MLGMTVLNKASASPADAAILSTMPDLLASFIRRWLCAPQVEVGQKGSKVLGDLLDVDCELPPPPPSAQGGLGSDMVLRQSPGHGKLWACLFRDRQMFTVLVDLCAGRASETASDPKQLSLAQGRLLRLLPRIAALNFNAVAASNFPLSTPVHSTNGNSSRRNHGSATTAGTTSQRGSGPGLLQWAALDMIDASDELMKLSLVDFFEAFVSLMRVTQYSAYKVETIRGLLREATAADETLRESILSLPGRTVNEEAEELERWIREIMPTQAVRVEGTLA